MLLTATSGTDGQALCFPEEDVLETANFFTKETASASARRAGDTIQEEARRQTHFTVLFTANNFTFAFGVRDDKSPS